MAIHSSIILQQARNLRLKGESYNKISDALKVSKSTLHYWFLDLPQSPFQRDPEARKRHLMKIRPLATAVIRANKISRIQNIQDKVMQEIKNFPFKNILVQRAIVSFLYWAEGSKTGSGNFKFANTDPRLCLLFITLLRNAFTIDEKNIRICLYLHYYHNINKMQTFWSDLLAVPKTQFEKIYIKSRKKTKKKRRNFAGICFIKYGKGGESLKQEVLHFGRAIQETISPCAHSSMDRT